MRQPNAQAIARLIGPPIPELNGYSSSARGVGASRLDTPWDWFGSYESGMIDFGSYGVPVESIRARSRSLIKQNGLAKSVVRCHVDNVIGRGVSLQSASDDEEFNDQAMTEWERFTTGVRSDYYRKKSWGRLQRDVQARKKNDGGAIVIMVDEQGFPKLQLLRMSWLSNPNGRRTNRIYRNGLEADLHGRVLAAHVRERNGRTRRIKRDNFIYLPNDHGDDELIGYPEFTGQFMKFDQTNGYIDSVVVGSRIGASAAGIIKETEALPTPGETNPTTGEFDPDAPGDNVDSADPGGEYDDIVMEPGVFQRLRAGLDIESWNPNQPQQQMPAAVATFVRFCCLGWGVSVAQVLKDFKGMNYSVSRAERLVLEREAEPERMDFCELFLKRVYKWVIDKAVNSGRITQPRPFNYEKVEVIPHHYPMVDPTKDVPAYILAEEAGVDSPIRFCTANGRDFKTISEQRKKARLILDANGLPHPGATDEAKAALAAAENPASPAAPAAPDEPTDDEGINDAA